jgi:hypothetical protein
MMNWFKSGSKLIAWIDKEKALHFVSTQSTNLIGGGDTEGLNPKRAPNFVSVQSTSLIADGNKEGFFYSIKEIITNFKNPTLPANKILHVPEKVNTQIQNKNSSNKISGGKAL